MVDGRFVDERARACVAFFLEWIGFPHSDNLLSYE